MRIALRRSTSAENDDLRARRLSDWRFEIAVGRNEDEVVTYGIFQNLAVAERSSPFLKGAFRVREEVV